MVERADLLIASARRRLRSMSREDGLVASVRRHDRRAFEGVYERHAPQLLNFCIYMVGSRADAEDALQATFISAYRALLADSRPVALRPWLFTIARNECLTIIRKRRNHSELNGEVALTGDPVRHAEVNEDLVGMFDSIRELPERQRAALVLAEFNGMSHTEIGSVLGVRPQQVKAYVYQARTHLLTDRQARDADCHEIREELANADGVPRLRARLRRHLRACDDCRAYADGVETQRHQLAALIPVLPVLTLKYRVIEDALRFGGSGDAAAYANTASAAGTAVEVGGAGVTALVAKVAAGVVAIGASAGVGVSVMSAPQASTSRAAAVTDHHGSHRLLASIDGSGSSRSGRGSGAAAGRGGGRLLGYGGNRIGNGAVSEALALRGETGAEGEPLPTPAADVHGETYGGEPPPADPERPNTGSGSGSGHQGTQTADAQMLASVSSPDSHRHGAIERREARTLHHEERLTEKAEHELSRESRARRRSEETETAAGGGEEEATKHKKSHEKTPTGHKKLPKGEGEGEREEETAKGEHKKHKHKREHKKHRKHEDGGEGEGETTP